MTYWCEHCHQGFHEDEVEGGQLILAADEINPPEYAPLVCPICGEEVIEGAECEGCGTPIDPDEVFCEECKDILAMQIERHLNDIEKRYFEEVDTFYKENK